MKSFQKEIGTIVECSKPEYITITVPIQAGAFGMEDRVKISQTLLTQDRFMMLKKDHPAFFAHFLHIRASIQLRNPTEFLLD